MQDGPRDFSTRLAGVDALRGIAFLMVFSFHCFLELNITPNGWVDDVYSGPWNFFFPNHFGLFGVQLFFVISGFCIHRSVLGLRQRNPFSSRLEIVTAYAGQRFWRIYPLYALVLVSLWATGSGRDPWVLGDLAIHAVFAHTLVPDHVNLFNPSFWSLAVEVQLYVLYPLLLPAMDRWGAVPVAGLCAALSLAWRLSIPDHLWFASLPWRWGYEWFLGIVIAEHCGKWDVKPKFVAFAGFAFSMLALSRSPALYAIIPPSFFAALLAFVASRQQTPRHTQPGIATSLSKLGGVSYALYLVHQPILTQIANVARVMGLPISEATSFLLTCSIGLGISLLLAVPLEGLGNRFRKQGWK